MDQEALERIERVDRVKRALANPVYFAEVYYRPYDPNWTDLMPQFAQDMLRFCRQARRGVVMLPPEFMKTTLVSQIYPLWLTYRSVVLGLQLRGMLASEEEGLAKSNLGVIAWHIENNELLKQDFTDDKGKPIVVPSAEEGVWRSDSLIVKRQHPSKDPTWQAKGLDSKGIQGRRLDTLIADDLVTPKNAASAATRKRALDFWDLQFETRLVASGQALICGNFNDVRDLLSTLAIRDGYRTFRRPSIHRIGEPWRAPRDNELMDAKKSVETWPQVWPRDRLLAERKSKPNRFRRIHLLDSRAEAGETLKMEWMRLIAPEETRLKSSRFFIGLDPAPGGGGEDLDYFNITVGAAHEGHLDIVESFDIRADVPRQVELVAAFHDRFQRLGAGVVAIGGARITMDRYMRGAITVKYPELNHKLVEISIPGSKEERLSALGPYAQSGWLRCWESAWLQLSSDSIDQWQELTLSEQWRGFPHSKHDDRLDGLDVCIRTAREFAMIGEVEVDLEVLEA